MNNTEVQYQIEVHKIIKITDDKQLNHTNFMCPQTKTKIVYIQSNIYVYIYIGTWGSPGTTEMQSVQPSRSSGVINGRTLTATRTHCEESPFLTSEFSISNQITNPKNKNK